LKRLHNDAFDMECSSAQCIAVPEALYDDHSSDDGNVLLERFVLGDTFFADRPELAGRMAAAGRVQQLTDGEAAGRYGDQARTISGVIDGSLITWLPIEDGSWRPVHMVRERAWFISFPLICGIPRRLTYTAAGNVRVFHVDQAEADALIAAHPELWRWIARVAAGHLDDAFNVCVGLLADRPITRIASRLLALSTAAEGAHVAIELKQSDLGLLSGLSRNTVSRTLGQLEARGLIARGYRRLRVLDPSGLARIAAGEDLT